MWSLIQSVFLSIIIILIGHFIWQMMRDSFSKPHIKSFVMESDKREEEAKLIAQAQQAQAQQAQAQQTQAQQTQAQQTQAQQAQAQQTQAQQAQAQQAQAQQAQAQQAQAQQAHEQPLNVTPINQLQQTTQIEDELDNYLKSKLNVLNTTDISHLSTHYDSPSGQETFPKN